MNDNDIQQTLASTFAVKQLSDERMDAISRTIRLGATKRRPRFKLLAGAGVFVSLAAAAGFTYPAAQAAIFGINVQRNMAAAGPYMIQISIDESKKLEGASRDRPCRIFIDGSDEYMPEIEPGSKTFLFIDGLHQEHVVHPASKVDVLFPPDSKVDAIFKLPITIMKQLGEFSLDKSIKDRGIKTVGGRKVDEVAVHEDGRDVLVLDIDPDKGVPISMIVLVTPDKSRKQEFSFPPFTERFDYVFDASTVRKSIADLKQFIPGTRQLGLVRDNAQIRRDFLSKPLSVTQTGRDVLKIYQVQQNAEGDVFVLYSCRGAHQDEQMPGNFLDLRDGHGRQWLTKIVDMCFNKLGVKGEDLKAQTFYHPDKPELLDLARLSMRIDRGDYLRFDEPSTRRTHVLNLGSYVPTKVDSVPIWFFYALSPRDEVWMPMSGLEVRFKHALSVKDYRTAIRIGLAFDAAYPDMRAFLFFQRSDLYRGLSQAYRGIGDARTARKYEANLSGPADGGMRD